MIHLVFLLIICLIHISFSSLLYVKNTRKKEIILIGLVIFIFGALRKNTVGIDVPGYCLYFDKIAKMNINEVLGLSYRDIGWPIFNKLLSYLSNDSQILLIVISAWVAFCFCYFIYKFECNALLITMFFICFRIYAFTLTGIRQAIAIGFLLISTVKLNENKKIQVVLFTLLGSLFHMSSLIFLISIPLYYIKNEKALFFFTLFFSLEELLSNFLLIEFFVNLTGGRFINYLYMAQNQNINIGSTFVILLIIHIFIFFYLDNLTVKEKKNDLLLFKLSCFGIMFFILGQGFDNMFRISYYFIIPLFLLFNRVENVLLSKNCKILINSLIVIFLISQYVIFGPAGGIDDYMFFWQ